MRQAHQHRDLERNLLDFCRQLRSVDWPVGSGQVIDCLRTLLVLGVSNMEQLRAGLRALIVHQPERIAEFDARFNDFWCNVFAQRLERTAKPSDKRRLMLESNDVQVLGRIEAASKPHLDPEDGQLRDVSSLGSAAGSAALATLLRTDVGALDPADADRLARVAAAIARRLALRAGRRYRPARRGRLIDTRRSMRASVRYEGLPLELARRRPRQQKPRVVVLCDVSRSMESYSGFLLHFLYGMQHAIGRIDSFVFSTQLTSVTDYLRHSNVATALDRMAHEVPDWSGGTRIAHSLKVLVNEHVGVLTAQSVVVILSDGLESGPPRELDAPMAKLRARVGRIFWLNPRFGGLSRAPLPAALQLVRPYLDVLAPAHDVASLEAVGRMLLRGRRSLTQRGAHLAASL